MNNGSNLSGIVKRKYILDESGNSAHSVKLPRIQSLGKPTNGEGLSSNVAKLLPPIATNANNSNSILLNKPLGGGGIPPVYNHQYIVKPTKVKSITKPPMLYQGLSGEKMPLNSHIVYKSNNTAALSNVINIENQK